MLGTIVVAESDPTQLEHIASILRNLNFNVLTAADGSHAYRLVRENLPDMVLAALELDEIDGYTLAQKLREDVETEGIPLMFIVEGSRPPDQLVGHETYAHDYIQKPISVPDFKSRVIGLLNLVRNRGPRRVSLSRKQRDAARSSLPVGVSPLRKQLVSQSDSRGNRESLGRRLGGAKSRSTQFRGSCQSALAEMSTLLGALQECLERLERSLISDRVRAELDETGEVPAPAREDGSAERSSSEDEVLEGEEVELGSQAQDESAALRSERKRLEAYRAEFRDRAAQGPVFCETGPSRTVDEVFELVFERGFSRASALRPDGEKKERRGGNGFRASSSTCEKKNSLPKKSKDAPSSEKLREIEDSELVEAARETWRGVMTPEEEAALDGSLYGRARGFVMRSIRRAAVAKSLEVSSGEELIEEMMLASQEELLRDALDRNPEFSITSHCVNVAILGMAVARALGRDKSFIKRVALGGLLHEVGVLDLPKNLVFKTAPLEDSELSALRKRPLLSGKILQRQETKLGRLVDIVSQVYERANGRGFPLGLERSEILGEAQVLGIVDFFEACIHRRPYRKPMTGYDALHLLATEESDAFDEELVKGLIRVVSLFPLYERVRLSNGALAVVVDINSGDLSRPTVEVISKDDSMGGASVGTRIDLSQDEVIRIAEILRPRIEG